MSVENRSSSALFKRAEQLKRWEESETNRESGTPRDKSKKIQFSLECVFLAACASGDKEEVLKLLNVGADIDTSNVDGLSALHQACIDDNLDMVEFLVEHGADINKGDNEGWTPLHATASCGFISIAKYLIEQGADIAAVNNDGELAVDIAESDEMEDLLHAVLREKGIDLDEARNKEEQVMLQHAKEWLNSEKYEDIPHEKTGATALHVAASKGYIKVMDTLIQAGADVNAQDFDGWTPLHAAAHWGQKEACEILVENFCDMDKKNYVGQTAFDVSEGEMVRLLEELRKKQCSLQKDTRSDINAIVNIKDSPKRRLSMNDKPSLGKEKDGTTEKQTLGQLILEEDVPPVDKVPKVELKIETESDEKRRIADENNDKNICVNNDAKPKIRNLPEPAAKVPINSVPSSPSKLTNDNDDVHVPSWRKPVSLRNAIRTPFRFEDEKLWNNNNTAASSESVAVHDDKAPEVVLRRTQSFEADDKFYRRYCELKAKIESGNTHPALIPPHTNNTGSLPTRSASLKERARKLMRDDILLPITSSTTPTCPISSTTNAISATAVQDIIAASTTAGVGPNSIISRTLTAQQVRSGNKNAANSVNATEQTTMSAPTTPIASKLSPGNIFKNFFKSFVPPVRDEESETQRKAHAKRVRETRRSTQGVTLEEIKSAEQLVKKKQQQQQQQLQLASMQLNSLTPTGEQTPSTGNTTNTEQNDVVVEPTSISVSATITTGTTTVPQTNKTTNERRPSWRLRIDNGCKFMLEDARRNEKDDDAINENVTRWTTSQSSPNEATDTATVTLPLRKPNKFAEDGELDREDNQEAAKNVPTTQPANPRRKRPKRRSTGAVQFDNEVDENEKPNSTGETTNEKIDNESGNGDKSGRSSRLSSASSVADEDFNTNQINASSPSENGELDYKKLYEETLVENERLRDKLRKTEDDLTECKLRLTDSSSSSSSTTNKNSLSEIEKREKRAMERKLSEMEEELKQLQKLKAENERLRAENRALTRVVSKLTTSANAVK
ncbi:protein phosphatase 1 regulatory subunit 12B isoform X3 [Planococcus citri]|uniref:protein phosphatase 1 regulatory subunit 12B isoform X3 n=1 Tax=Planococcus citri TaxID=170843 RepID=UPI0031F8E698